MYDSCDWHHLIHRLNSCGDGEGIGLKSFNSEKGFDDGEGIG